MHRIMWTSGAAVVCVALAVLLSWNALPANAAGGSCPYASAKSCPYTAKASDSCCGAKKALNAINFKGGCCADKDAKQVAERGVCTDKDIATLMATDGRFTTLALAVKAAGMTGELRSADTKTFLAPTNAAFQKIPAKEWAAILQDDAKLKALIANHIIKDDAIKPGELKDASSAKTEVGSQLAVSTCPKSGQVSINNAKVIGSTLVASNGVVHVIDSVLLPDMQVAKANTPAPVHVAAAK